MYRPTFAELERILAYDWSLVPKICQILHLMDNGPDTHNAKYKPGQWIQELNDSRVWIVKGRINDLVNGPSYSLVAPSDYGSEEATFVNIERADKNWTLVQPEARLRWPNGLWPEQKVKVVEHPVSIDGHVELDVLKTAGVQGVVLSIASAHRSRVRLNHAVLLGVRRENAEMSMGTHNLIPCE